MSDDLRSEKSDVNIEAFYEPRIAMPLGRVKKWLLFCKYRDVINGSVKEGDAKLTLTSRQSLTPSTVTVGGNEYRAALSETGYGMSGSNGAISFEPFIEGSIPEFGIWRPHDKKEPYIYKAERWTLKIKDAEGDNLTFDNVKIKIFPQYGEIEKTSMNLSDPVYNGKNGGLGFPPNGEDPSGAFELVYAFKRETPGFLADYGFLQVVNRTFSLSGKEKSGGINEDIKNFIDADPGSKDFRKAILSTRSIDISAENKEDREMWFTDSPVIYLTPYVWSGKKDIKCSEIEKKILLTDVAPATECRYTFSGRAYFMMKPIILDSDDNSYWVPVPGVRDAVWGISVGASCNADLAANICGKGGVQPYQEPYWNAVGTKKSGFADKEALPTWNGNVQQENIKISGSTLVAAQQQGYPEGKLKCLVVENNYLGDEDSYFPNLEENIDVTLMDQG